MFHSFPIIPWAKSRNREIIVSSMLEWVCDLFDIGLKWFHSEFLQGWFRVFVGGIYNTLHWVKTILVDGLSHYIFRRSLVGASFRCCFFEASTFVFFLWKKKQRTGELTEPTEPPPPNISKNKIHFTRWDMATVAWMGMFLFFNVSLCWMLELLWKSRTSKMLHEWLAQKCFIFIGIWKDPLFLKLNARPLSQSITFLGVYSSNFQGLFLDATYLWYCWWKKSCTTWDV